MHLPADSDDGIEASLREIDIPTKRKGGISFFDTKEVVFVLNLLSLLYNPKDMMAFIHILSYVKGIGNALAKDIYEALVLLGNGNPIQGLLKPDKTIQEPFKKREQNIQLGLFDDFYTCIQCILVILSPHPSLLLSHSVSPTLHPILSPDLCKYRVKNID